MPYLVDTNILVCEADIANPYHSLIDQIFAKLRHAGDILYITSQNLVEFRNVATRETSKNGLGLTASDVDEETQRLKQVFPLLMETSSIFPVWETIVRDYAVIGKQVHDARLVAICQVYSISHLLTFNIGDFKRYDPIVKAVSPLDLASLH